MIPARIISIDDKVMVEWYNLPEPSAKIYTMPIYYDKAMFNYEKSKTIAEVENIVNISGWWFFWYERIHLNDKVYIEPTTPGKAKIVKI